MSDNTPQTREQVLQQITSRAATDGDFRAQLISDPHAAVRQAVGIEIPSNFRIKFVEKGSDLDALVVLPDLVSESAELSEEELEAVAGGSEWSIIRCVGTIDVAV